MRRIMSSALVAALTASCMLSPAPAYSQDGMASLDDVLLLAQNDISDQTILTFLKYRRLDFPLDAKAVQRLRDGGVSDDVIRFVLERDDTTIVALPAYVVPTGYRTGYPSYYYGARLVGATEFPLGWYNHHYFRFGYTTVYSYPQHHSPSHSLGHSVGITPGHDRYRLHVPGLHGGNHLIGHGGHSPGHSGRYSLGHSIRHRRGH